MRSWSGGWPSRARAAARSARTRSRSPEAAAARRVAPLARRIRAANPAGRRRKQHSLPGQRADLRRAAGRRPVHPAAARSAWPMSPRASRADRRSIRPRSSTASSRRTIRRQGAIRSRSVERLLAASARNRGQISLCRALPAFIWFSTRLFAGVRTVAQRHLRRLRSAVPAAQLPGPWLRSKAARL